MSTSLDRHHSLSHHIHTERECLTKRQCQWSNPSTNHKMLLVLMLPPPWISSLQHYLQNLATSSSNLSATHDHDAPSLHSHILRRVKVNLFLFFMTVYCLSFPISHYDLLCSLPVGVGDRPRHPWDHHLLPLLGEVRHMGIVSVAVVGARRTRGYRCMLPLPREAVIIVC